MTRAGNDLNYDEDLIDILEEQNLNWIYWNYKNIRGIPDTQAVYITTTANKSLELLSEIENGKSILDFTEIELNQALESLKTSNFDVKDDLKDLIIEAF